MNQKLRYECPVCRELRDFTSIFQVSQYALTGQFFFSCQQMPKPRLMTLGHCEHCSFVKLLSSGFETKDYSKVDRDTAGQLPHYTPQLIDLIQAEIDKDGKILEVGSNDGSFLNQLKAYGYENIVGIEPSESLAKIANQNGLKTINRFFNIVTAQDIIGNLGQVDMVICRHTLEHVPNPQELLDAMHLVCNENCRLLIEVPDASHMFDNVLGHEVWDEHINYFTKETLNELVSSAGFKSVDIKSWDFRGTKNLILIARKLKNFDRKKSLVISIPTPHSHLTFEHSWMKISEKLLSNLDGAAKPIFAIGASHPQINFLNFSGSSDYVDFLVDDDPNKVGKFVQFDRGVQVIDTKSLLLSEGSGTIILTAFNQKNWQESIINQVTHAGRKFTLIDPYSL